MRAALVGNPEGWHATQLAAALERRGVTVSRFPATRLSGSIGASPGASSLGASLADQDLVLVRAIPSGSLEQVIFRLDMLHLLRRRGVRVVNSPEALERSVDKFTTSALLEEAGIPTPRTEVTENLDEALACFRRLGGDVVVKPLFGSEGKGIVRLRDSETAWMTFRALDLGRSVFYLQQFVPHGNEDFRLFVVGEEVAGAMVRRGEDWRSNLARGGRGERFAPDEHLRSLAIRAARAVGAFYAGVDILPGPDGPLVGEVNGIPGWKGLEAALGVCMAELLVERLLGASLPGDVS
ncbi:RimK family alpha-L-glutamate ligase [Aminiphilus circumscriptus]|uniref:RimK family alpha-L-glutamate ligase n=1 Tax=Aminiphilus circumscriptus TaxID=290732 RepID=UPI00047853C7|nr:RimK family alpha-L-glutamate ligase [Aminiphilus circumscriptus]